jgi:hypothetical protein
VSVVETLVVVLALLLVAGVVLVVITWPLLSVVRQRLAVGRERRLAEWRLQALTARAMQEMLRHSREPR